MEAAAQQLQEENRRIKVRTNEQDERLKRLETQVKKEEALVGAQSKKAGVRPDQLKDSTFKDATVRKLLQHVKEREKQNVILERHASLYRHAFPAAAGFGVHKAAQNEKRPLSATPSRNMQPPTQGTSSPPGKKIRLLMQGTDEDDQVRLVLVLEGELERAREALTQLRAELVVSSKQGQDASELASINSSTESEFQLTKRFKEMGARLTILLSTQERTRTAFKEEEDQHPTLVNEVESLENMLAQIREDKLTLGREKEIMRLRKGDADDSGKLIADTRKELEQLDSDNKSLRDKAFKTGGIKVSVRATEDEQRIKLEENASLTEELKRLQAKVEQLQVEADEADKGPQGSVQSMQQTISNLDQQSRHLQKETERLRDKMMHSLAGQQKSAPSSLHAPSSTRGGFGLPRNQDKGQEVRRLRRENAQQVREIRKGEQELLLHKLLVNESEQLEADLSKHIESISKLQRTKSGVLQRKLTLLEINNERLRAGLHDLQLGKQTGSHSVPTVPAAGDAVRGGAAAAGTTRSVVEICVEGLVLDKSHRALEGAEEPRTMLLLDFFMHDTQYSSPLVGLVPRGRLERSFETLVDHLLMHYLYTDALRIQLVRIVGLDAEPLGECNVPLSQLIESPSSTSLVLHRVEIVDATVRRGSGNAGRQCLGHLNVTLKFLSSIKEAARSFLAHAPKSVLGLAPTRPGEQESLLQLKEEMVRRVGAKYTLRVSVSAVSGARSKLAVVAMFQLLDADVSASDAVTTAADGSAKFVGGQSVVQLEATQELDKRLLSQAMDVCLFDDSDALDQNGLLGAGHLLLAPLLHRRGVSGIIQLYSGDKSGVVGSLSIDVSWDPEPVGGVAVASTPASSKSSVTAVAWDVRNTLWKIRVWAESLDMGSGFKAFQGVFEALLESAQQSGGQDAADAAGGLTSARWQRALIQEGSRMSLTTAQMQEVHAHLAAGAYMVGKEAFVKALISAVDPGSAPKIASAGGVRGVSGVAVDEHIIVPEEGEETEESQILRPSAAR